MTKSDFPSEFSTVVRDLFEANHKQLHIPGSGDVYDYFVDFQTAKFRAWSDIVPTFQYNPNISYFEVKMKNRLLFFFFS